MFGAEKLSTIIVSHKEHSLTNIPMGELLILAFKSFMDPMVLGEDRASTPFGHYEALVKPSSPSYVEEIFSEVLP